MSGVATFAVGAIGDSLGWAAAALLLVGLTVAQIVIGFFAGRNVRIS
jgi:cyanate permease